MDAHFPEWTVLTWNVQGAKSTDLDRIASFVRDHAPDVVLLQEVRRPQYEQLAGALGMTANWTFKHFAFSPFFTRFAEGTAMLTPHRLSATGDMVISSVRTRRSWRRRTVQWGLVERADHTAYRVVNAHMTPHGLRRQRLEEAERITQLVEELGDEPPVVLGGDFNDREHPELVLALPGVEHLRPAATNPAEDPIHVLDHVLLPAEATAVSVTVPAGGPQWHGVSDHLPVVVRFSLRWVRGEFV